MTHYTATFTATVITSRQVDADSPEHALELARDFQRHYADLLEFKATPASIDRIEIAGIDEEGWEEVEVDLVVWESDNQHSRRLADRFLDAAQAAFALLASAKPADP